MRVYVDFDRTLFDCDKFIEDFYAIITKYNIDKTLFKECQNQSRRKGFNPYIILGNLEKKYEFNRLLYLDVDKLMNNTSNYLYPDAIPFLEYLKGKNYQVIILTKGNSDYQREKIFNEHIDKYFDKLIVTMRHKGLLLLNYYTGIFIDDNPREIDSLWLRKPKKIIRIARPNSKYSDIDIKQDIVTFKSLNDLMESKII